MPRLRLAVISDLHIGMARSHDLCPYWADECRTRGSGFKCRIPYDAEATAPRCHDEGYLDTFQEFTQGGTVVADYLVVLGDLTHRGQPDEFQHAATALERIRGALSVPQGNVILVPGNHDVDWQVPALPDKTGVRFEQRFFPLAHKKWDLAKLMKKGAPAGWGCFGEPYFSVWSDRRLLVVLYNSSWNDRKDEKVHHGRMDSKHLQALDEWLQSRSTDAKTRVLAVHHHPVDYPNPFSDAADFSKMEGATPQLMELLHRMRFDLILHGHKHRPYFLPITSYAEHHIPILCAGSFSAIPDGRMEYDAPNVFHVVELDKRPTPDSASARVPERGRVMTWAFYPEHGWVRMPATEGIGWREPFGTYMSRGTLLAELQAWVKAELDSTGSAKSAALFRAKPQLEYVETRLMSDVVDELKTSDDLERSIPDDDPIGFVLTRRV